MKLRLKITCVALMIGVSFALAAPAGLVKLQSRLAPTKQILVESSR